MTYFSTDLKRLHDQRRLRWADFTDRLTGVLVVIILAVAVVEWVVR